MEDKDGEVAKACRCWGTASTPAARPVARCGGPGRVNW